MTISIIGPEGSGKTTLAEKTAKRAAHGRPIYIVGRLKSQFHPIDFDKFDSIGDNCVVIVDDANAYMDSYEINRKDSPMRAPIILSRHRNRLNIFIFHSFDDSVKFPFRQSRYIYVSTRYKDKAYTKNKFISGIMPEIIGDRKYSFFRYKRY